MIARSAKHVLVAVLAMALLPMAAHAEIFGDKIRPYVSVAGIFDSNVFRVSDGAQLIPRFGSEKTSDFISIYSAGFDIVYPVSQQTFTVSGRKDFVRYASFNDYNVTQDDLRAGLTFRILDRIVGDLHASYLKVLEPFENYQGFQKSLRSTSVVGGSAGYAFPWGLTLKGGGRLEKVDYSLDTLAGSEYEAKSFFGQAVYQHSPKTEFDLELRRTWYDYSRTADGAASPNDSTANLLQGGFQYMPGAKTQLVLHAGLMKRTYDVATWRDFHGVVGRFDLKYAITAKLAFSLRAERSLVEETFLDQTYSVNDAVGADLTWRVLAKTEIGVGGKLTNKDFQSANNLVSAPLENRKDRIRELHAGASWTPGEQLQLSVTCRRSSRSSNYAQYDYKDRTIELGITYKF